jgi:transcription initiation factor TFIID subunit TAF12
MTGQQLLGALQQQQQLQQQQVQLQQQQQQQQQVQQQIQQQAPAAVAAAAVSPDVPAEWAAGRKNHGVEQGQLGVRVAEFHELSPFAVFVQPSSALKLQSLWDSGNELVSC